MFIVNIERFYFFTTDTQISTHLDFLQYPCKGQKMTDTVLSAVKHLLHL